jgi:hypothetical protein
MCRNMDINYYKSNHEKIKQQFHHDIIMGKIKQREDKEFRYMFVKVLLIITSFVLLVMLITSR